MNNVKLSRYPINPIVIGKIGGVYGIKGYLKIISFTDQPDNIFKYSPWFVLFQCQWKIVQLRCWRYINKYYIAKVNSICNRNDAMSLMRCNLVIDRTQLPILNDIEEYYWNDIIGCNVIHINGSCLGYVIRIIETSAHDVLVVKINNNINNSIKASECLIPFVYKRIIKNINLIDNIIIVDWDLF